MRTVSVNVYTFNELSPKAKEKAIERYREVSMTYDWWEFVYADWEKKLESIGFLSPDIRFRGFWSQGDGASFTAQPDVQKLVEHLISQGKKEYRHLRWVVNNHTESEVLTIDHHYSHEYTKRFAIHFYRERCKRVEKLVRRLEEDIEELRRDLCKQIYNALEEEYEALTTDEAIGVWIMANDLEFEESGKTFHA